MKKKQDVVYSEEKFLLVSAVSQNKTGSDKIANYLLNPGVYIRILVFITRTILPCTHIYDCYRKLSTLNVVSSVKYKPYQIDAQSVAPAKKGKNSTLPASLQRVNKTLISNL